MNLTPKKQNGFTLIEIVIVLAIAALIMVIVFLAVAGAQRSQRDNTNKAAAGQALAQAENFLANSGGQFPSTAMPSSYLSGIKTTTGNPTSVAPGGSATATASGQVVVITKSTCSGTAAAAGSATQSAVVWFSEGANSQQCINN